MFDYIWPLLTFTTMLFISGWLLGFLSEKLAAAVFVDVMSPAPI